VDISWNPRKGGEQAVGTQDYEGSALRRFGVFRALEAVSVNAREITLFVLAKAVDWRMRIHISGLGDGRMIESPAPAPVVTTAKSAPRKTRAIPMLLGKHQPTTGCRRKLHRSDKHAHELMEAVMCEHYREPAKEVCDALSDHAVSEDDRRRQNGEADVIDDKTVSIVKRT
jgi:hypothetical protein